MSDPADDDLAFHISGPLYFIGRPIRSESGEVIDIFRQSPLGLGEVEEESESMDDDEEDVLAFTDTDLAQRFVSETAIWKAGWAPFTPTSPRGTLNLLEGLLQHGDFCVRIDPALGHVVRCLIQNLIDVLSDIVESGREEW